MSHPLSDEAIAHIEKSWGLVQEFGLQEAGIVMFKRSVGICENKICNTSYLNTCFAVLSLCLCMATM